MTTKYGFNLNLETGNAAFDDGNAPHEIARILRDVARRIEGGEDCYKFRNVLDVNGNIVGQFRFKPENE
jgi:hypothetical protein